MPQGYIATMAAQQAVGTFFNSYTTAKTVINPQALWTVPAGWFQYIGQRIKVSVQGALSNIVTTPGTVTFQVMMGSIVAFTTGAIQMSTTAHTKLPFWLEIYLTLLTVGSGTSATFKGQAVGVSQAFSISTSDATSGHSALVAPNTTPAAGTGWDSTIANVFDFWTGFSSSQSGNGVEIHQYQVIDG